LEHYSMVEKIFRQSAEFCSEDESWKLNVAHIFFMQEKFKECIRYYEPFVRKHYDNLLSVTAIILANLCVAYVMTSANEEAEELMRLVEKEEEVVVPPVPVIPPKAAWGATKTLADHLREKKQKTPEPEEKEDFDVVEEDHQDVESHVSYTLEEEDPNVVTRNAPTPTPEIKAPEPEPVEEKKEEPTSPELKKISALEVELFYCRAPAKQRFLRGCIQSLKGNTEEAIKQLLMAKKKGYNDITSLQNDPNLENARYHPRWTEICPPKAYSLLDPSNARNVRSMEPQVLTLLSIFPHVSIEAASAALVASKGNLEEAVQHLLK